MFRTFVNPYCGTVIHVTEEKQLFYFSMHAKYGSIFINSKQSLGLLNTFLLYNISKEYICDSLVKPSTLKLK